MIELRTGISLGHGYLGNTMSFEPEINKLRYRLTSTGLASPDEIAGCSRDQLHSLETRYK